MSTLIKPIGKCVRRFGSKWPSLPAPRIVHHAAATGRYTDSGENKYDRKPPSDSRTSASSLLLAVFGGFLLTFSFTKRHPKAASDDGDDEKDKELQRKRRVGFRDRRVISYEDRLRAYSTPDKLFRYFATVRRSDSIFMTPDDFVRSITPGVKQPDGLGLDSFQRYTTDVENRQKLCLSQDSVFYKFGKNALISFADYVFLLTLLASPPRQVEVAFRMFDRNGDGVLEKKEFEVVRSIIMSSTAVGKRHRDREVTGNTLRSGTTNAAGSGGGAFNLVLSTYFFGKDGSKKLSVDEFMEFQAQVQLEVSRIEFNRFQPEDGRIHELDFASALLMYAGFSDNKRKRMMRRVRQVFPRRTGEDEDEDEGDAEKAGRKWTGGISFDEYSAFFCFLRGITDVDTALSFYNFAGLPVDRSTFSHVAQTVTKTKLSDRVLDVMFLLFDENEDDHLSQREFISVMKRRQMRCLDRPMDTGFVRMVSSHLNCLWEQTRFRPMDEGHCD